MSLSSGVNAPYSSRMCIKSTFIGHTQSFVMSSTSSVQFGGTHLAVGGAMFTPRTLGFGNRSATSILLPGVSLSGGFVDLGHLPVCPLPSQYTEHVAPYPRAVTERTDSVAANRGSTSLYALQPSFQAPVSRQDNHVCLEAGYSLPFKRTDFIVEEFIDELLPGPSRSSSPYRYHDHRRSPSHLH